MKRAREIWTRTMDIHLQELVERHLNSTQIGTLMGKSRCAILGRIGRLGLSLASGQRRVKWTEAMDAQLARLAAKGLTAAEIGEEMGENRESIKSRARHLPGVNLGARNQFARPSKPVSRPTRRVTDQERAQLKAALGVQEGILLEDMPRKGCRYPVNDGPPFRFCGNDEHKHGYCDKHYVISRAQVIQGTL